jgi:hypothetical protein
MDARGPIRAQRLVGVRDRLLRGLAGGIAAQRAIGGAARSGSVEAAAHAYPAVLHRLAAGLPSVLDVGTGTMRTLATLPCPVKVGIDAHRPYLENRVPTDAVGIHAAASDLPSLFVPGAVALVTMLDFIEHLEREAALLALDAAEQVASQRVAVFTPRGWFPQEGYDALGLGGEEMQKHRSAWDVGDFRELGYKVIVLARYHDARNLAFVEAFGENAPPVDALFAWKDVSRA